MSRRARVIVDKEYFDLLVEKSDILEDVFEIFDSLKDVPKMLARSHKIPPEAEGSEPYEEPRVRAK